MKVFGKMGAILTSLLLAQMPMVQAKNQVGVEQVVTTAGFNRALKNHPLGIAMLYDSTQNVEKLEKLLEKFNSLSRGTFIKKGDFALVSADVSKGALKPLVEQFKLDATELPAFLLFRQGQPVYEDDGTTLAVQYGYVGPDDLFIFIDTWFGKERDEIVEAIRAKAKMKKQVPLPEPEEAEEPEATDENESADDQDVVYSDESDDQEQDSSATFAYGDNPSCYYNFPYIVCDGNSIYNPYWSGYPYAFWGWPGGRGVGYGFIDYQRLHGHDHDGRHDERVRGRHDDRRGVGVHKETNKLRPTSQALAGTHRITPRMVPTNSGAHRLSGTGTKATGHSWTRPPSGTHRTAPKTIESHRASMAGTHHTTTHHPKVEGAHRPSTIGAHHATGSTHHGGSSHLSGGRATGHASSRAVGGHANEHAGSGHGGHR